MRKRELSIVEHLNMASSSSDSTAEKEKMDKAISELSLSRFFDWSQPWVLIPGGSYQGFFDFLPRHLRCGPWSFVAISSVRILILTMLMIGVELYKDDGGILVLFEDSMPRHNYVAFDRDWYLTLAGFLWMLFICWYVYANGPKGKAAWVTFSLWSWTVVMVRHGLCLLAPFAPSIRLASEILRFPALLSATLVFVMWNFVLFPVILICIKDYEKRSKFLAYMTNFRLTQLHVFIIVYAAVNGAFVEPRRSLHMGDAAAASIFLTFYMIWYYCVLDRLG
ncbi:MAG: hypothetical protein SGBAC_003291, partial [Bacillariaceae sp.]